MYKSIITARKRSLQRLCFYTCLSVILFTGEWGCLPLCMMGCTPPPTGSSACWEIRATNGRYASYWNAYLFFNFFAKILLENERIWTQRGSVSLVTPLDPPMSLMKKLVFRTNDALFRQSYRSTILFPFQRKCANHIYSDASHNIWPKLVK